MHRNERPVPDWDPFASSAIGDQRDLYDAMRTKCPVAYSDRLQWSLFRHDDVMRALTDHETFSNNVSRYLTVPNGMDPPEHTVYRDVIVPYFSDERLQQFEPVCRSIVAEKLRETLVDEFVDLVTAFGLDVSVRIHCAFLGWPASLHESLASWTDRSRLAARANDQAELAHIAREFQELVDDMLSQRRELGATPEHDVTAELMHETVFDRPLDEVEIASILRNWTVGEIGTMSASIGILAHFLAEHPDLQTRLRAEPGLLPAAIEEILRLHGPLVTNRRVTTCPIEIGGRAIGAGEQITLNWVSANRDERVFEEPHTFSLDRDHSKNLLWGAGIHVCPGAPLARLELRLIMEELLGQTECFELDAGRAPVLAEYPASGFASLPLRISVPGSAH